MEISKLIGAAVLIYIIHQGFCLYRNYARAKATGFKVRVSLFEIGTPLFSLFGALTLPIVKRIFPQSIVRTIDLGVYGVEWRDRVLKREREAPGYVVVSPSSTIELYVEDGEIANAILAKRKEFEQDPVSMKIMNQFGPSLAGSNGDAWSRQRRLIAPMLNERIMETVWSESHEQTQDMMAHFVSTEKGITTGTVVGLRKIAFNILSEIGYGMPTHWNADTKKSEKNEKMEFMEALLHLVDGLILLAIFPPRLLKQSWMPSALRQIGRAYDQFLQHSSELLQKERIALKSSGTLRNTFLSSLAAVNDDEADPYEKDGRLNKAAFTEDQITGNLYTFTLAGYDTTANTMAYAVAMLAAYPKWQQWIIEEIDQVRHEVSDPSSYQQVLPRLVRCLSLMFETLRVFTPVAHIVRTCPTEQVITNRGKNYYIPANARCTINLDGFGARREIWGDDAFEFRPSRWSASAIERSEKTSAAQVPKLESAGAKSFFLPWSSGPRACPGIKMAQTEFLSVIYTIFSEYRAEPALEVGETLEQGCSRMAKVVENSQPKLTLQMNKPEQLKLKWIRRS